MSEPTPPAPHSLIADPALAAASGALREALRGAGDALDADGLRRALGAIAKNLLLRAFAGAGADHGAIWLADAEGEHLVPLFGCGERAGDFLDGRFRLPLGEGMLSMVFATGQPICENEVHAQPGHSAELDRRLGVRTEAMLAVPLHFAGRLRGVVSCVHLAPAEAGPARARSFTGADLSALELAAAAVARLLDLALVESLLGWAD